MMVRYIRGNRNSSKEELHMSTTMKNRETIQKIVGTGVLMALVIVLQVFASGIRIGNLSLTFSLVPIVIGAVLYGPAVGALLGGVFGIVVTVATVTGADAGAYMMFEKLPVLTVILCMVKGIAAGLVSGLICKAFEKSGKETLGIFLSAIACPVTNTGIFCVCLLAFYRDIAVIWMGDAYANVFIYVLLGIVGVNFLVELAINIVLAPAIVRVIGAIRKQH